MPSLEKELSIASKKNKSGGGGVSLYFALMIMTVLLAIALGISTILFGQLKVMRGMENSIVAFYAADTGIEKELYEEHPPGTHYSDYLDLNGNGFQDSEDSVYNVWVISAGGDSCPATVNYCIKSIGVYKETRRAIYATR